VDKLATITQVLVEQRAALAEVLDVAPLALGNAVNTYNAASGTLDARADLNELTSPPIVMVCRLLEQATPKEIPPLLTDVCKTVAPLAKGVPSLAQVIHGLQTSPFPIPLGGGQ
jgi:hypothetical protein